MNQMDARTPLVTPRGAKTGSSTAADAPPPAWVAPAHPPHRRLPFKLTMFLLVCVLPSALFSGYVYLICAPQYISEFRFSVQHVKPVLAVGRSPIGGLLSDGLAGMSLVESETAVQYIKSRQLLDDAAAALDFPRIYSTPIADWWWRLQSHAPIEAATRYWQRMVDANFDLASGIITVRVRAFSPFEAQAVATTVHTLVEQLINAMSMKARRDSESYALSLVNEAEARLRRQELALRDFRNANTLLQPDTAASVSTRTQSALREKMTEIQTTLNVYKLQQLDETSPRYVLLRNKLASLRDELKQAQDALTRTGAGDGDGRPLASTIADYDSLEIERKIAETAYTSALEAWSAARANADQQGLYLATFVRPGLPEQALFPDQFRWVVTFTLSSLVAWALLLLIGYAVRDHME